MRALLLLSLLSCAACTWFKRNHEVLITSDPAGAQIWLNGHDTGHITPKSLDIAGNFGSDHLLELKKKGYRTEHRVLYQHTRGYTSRWIDGGGSLELPPMPIFWTLGDFTIPFAVKGAMVPGELYVKLYGVEEPLLGFDVLRAKAANQGGANPAPTQGQ